MTHTYTRLVAHIHSHILCEDHRPSDQNTICTDESTSQYWCLSTEAGGLILDIRSLAWRSVRSWLKVVRGGWCRGCNKDIRPNSFQFKSREISSSHILIITDSIVLKFCTDHYSYTVVLCATFQNDWSTETGVMDANMRYFILRWVLDGYLILPRASYR